MYVCYTDPTQPSLLNTRLLFMYDIFLKLNVFSGSNRIVVS